MNQYGVYCPLSTALPQRLFITLPLEGFFPSEVNATVFRLSIISPPALISTPRILSKSNHLDYMYLI